MGKKNRKSENILPPDDPSFSNQSPFRIMERTLKRTVSVQQGIEHPYVVRFDEPGHLSHRQIPISLKSETSLNPNAKAYIFDNHPGLILMKNALYPRMQAQIVIKSLEEYAKYPNVSNLDSHFMMPQQGIWNHYVALKANASLPLHLEPRKFESESVSTTATVVYPPDDVTSSNETDSQMRQPPSSSESLVIIDPPTDAKSSPKPALVSDALLRMRWVTLGYQYNWTKKEYHFDRQPAFPEFIATLTNEIIESVQPLTQYPFNRWSPEAGIINFYQPGDMLMAHQDRSEKSMEPPLISLSVGIDGILLIGSETRETQPIGILLQSGDVLVMSGPSRRVFHGVPKVYPKTAPLGLLDSIRDILSLPEHALKRQLMTDYISHTRLNLNVRQVIPK